MPLEIASWQDPTIWSIWTAFDLAAGTSPSHRSLFFGSWLGYFDKPKNPAPTHLDSEFTGRFPGVVRVSTMLCPHRWCTAKECTCNYIWGHRGCIVGGSPTVVQAEVEPPRPSTPQHGAHHANSCVLKFGGTGMVYSMEVYLRINTGMVANKRQVVTIMACRIEPPTMESALPRTTS